MTFTRYEHPDVTCARCDGPRYMHLRFHGDRGLYCSQDKTHVFTIDDPIGTPSVAIIHDDVASADASAKMLGPLTGMIPGVCTHRTANYETFVLDLMALRSRHDSWQIVVDKLLEKYEIMEKESQ